MTCDAVRNKLFQIALEIYEPRDIALQIGVTTEAPCRGTKEMPCCRKPGRRKENTHWQPHEENPHHLQLFLIGPLPLLLRLFPCLHNKLRSSAATNVRVSDHAT